MAREAAEDGPSGPRHPPLRLAYVNPAFRAVSHLPGRDQPHEEGWWDGVPVDEEIQEFLTRYLASPSATALPLLVLGHPGAGKSVFTRVLAARLGAIDYSVVRVDLRAVAADAPIYQQISTAIEKSLTRRVEWAELTRAARREAPVVFLDGLDELIQSSAVSRADYLEQVREFQRTELDRGCPVIVVVTSRTVVAHRVRIPDGTVVLRLEPFDEPRIRRWLDGWNRHNAGYFASAPVSPLQPETVLAHPGLAAQPLLLFMLALYDSGDNALQNEGDSFGGSDLYERLLQEFAHREIRKHQPYAEDSELKQLVETELETLSIAAFAMFNRGRLAVLEGELDADLGAFRAAPARGGQAARSDTARKLVSRFFFVHVSQGKAIDAGEERTASAYEFLHATFGEYLVARLTFGALLHTHESGRRGGNSLNMMGAAPDYGLLGALLSFELLCARTTVIGFLRDAADRIGRAKRRLLVALLIDGLQEALAADDWNGIAGYRPREASVPARLSVRTANLVQLLLVLGGPTGPPELFPDSADPAEQWRSLVSLWQATLSAQSWQLLSDTVGAVERDGGLRIDLDPVMIIGDDYENHRSLESFLRWGELAGDPDVQWIFDTIRPLLRIAPPRGVRPWSAALLTAFAFGNLREAHALAVIADDASEMPMHQRTALLNAVIGLLPVLPGPMPPDVLAAVLDAYDTGVDDDEPLIDLLLDATRPDRGIPPDAEEFRGALSALAGRIRWIEKTRRRVEAAIALAGLGLRDHDLPYGLWLLAILRDETYLALLAGDQRLTARLLEVVRLTGRRKAAARAAHLLIRIQDPDPWLLRDIDVRFVLDSARRPEPAIALMAGRHWHEALRRHEIGRIAGLLRAGLSRRNALHRVASVLRAAAGDRNHRAGL